METRTASRWEICRRDSSILLESLWVSSAWVHRYTTHHSSKTTHLPSISHSTFTQYSSYIHTTFILHHQPTNTHHPSFIHYHTIHNSSTIHLPFIHHSSTIHPPFIHHSSTFQIGYHYVTRVTGISFSASYRPSLSSRPSR